MSDRPDYVRCVLLGTEENGKPVSLTWCDRNHGRRPPFEFAFVDASHAALNALGGGRLLVCPECAAAIAKTIVAGAWKKEGIS